MDHWLTIYAQTELLEGAKSYRVNPFPILKIHEQTLKTEVTRLTKIGGLKCENNSQKAAQTFMSPEINVTVRFISVFRKLNKRIETKQNTIPTI